MHIFYNIVNKNMMYDDGIKIRKKRVDSSLHIYEYTYNVICYVI